MKTDFASCLVALTVALVPRPSIAGSSHFGAQERADAAHQLIVLAVQQGISALPPASGQALLYQYNPEEDTYSRSAQLGPTALRSTRTIGSGKLSLRVAASYFDLAQRFAPITYSIEPENPESETPQSFAKLGLDAEARVGVLSFAATYGLTHYLDVSLTVPLTIVDATAKQSFTTRTSTLGDAPKDTILTAARTRADLEAALQRGLLAIRREKFSAIGFDFDDGTHAGVGRIALGARAVVFSHERVRLLLAPEIFLPSPSEDDFAGSQSFALLPRMVGEAWLSGPVRLLGDVGYDYDTSHSELRRFVFNGGLQAGLESVAVDFGLSGSLYDTPVQWTPAEARGQATGAFPATRVQALEDNTLGDDFFDFVFGLKVRLAQQLVLSGAVSVPLNNQGFRPAAVGTLALEMVR